MLQEDTQQQTFASIIDGKIRIKCDKDDPKAVKREYETKDKETKVKYEHVYKSVKAFITNISYKDTDFGQQMHVTLADTKGEEIVLSCGSDSPFATSIMKRLPNADINKEVVLAPYSFIGDNGKTIRGVTVMQDDQKLNDYFYDGTKNLNGMPEPGEDATGFDKDDWKMYFIKVKKFLIDYTEKNIKCKVMEESAIADEAEEVFAEPETKTAKTKAKIEKIAKDNKVTENDLPF